MRGRCLRAARRCRGGPPPGQQVPHIPIRLRCLRPGGRRLRGRHRGSRELEGARGGGVRPSGPASSGQPHRVGVTDGREEGECHSAAPAVGIRVRTGRGRGRERGVRVRGRGKANTYWYGRLHPRSSPRSSATALAMDVVKRIWSSATVPGGATQQRQCTWSSATVLNMAAYRSLGRARMHKAQPYRGNAGDSM